jgi:hypothetical protein
MDEGLINSENVGALTFAAAYAVVVLMGVAHVLFMAADAVQERWASRRKSTE